MASDSGIPQDQRKLKVTQTLAHREKFTETEVEHIIGRAQEIELRDRLNPAYSPDEICATAHEMGVSEQAVSRALEEHRLRRLIGPPQYVFALKFDNRYYIAEQICTHGSRAEIRYLDGTTTAIDRELTFPAALSPGQFVSVRSRNGWWLPATITSFDPTHDHATIRFTLGKEVEYSFADLRLNMKQIHDNINIRETRSNRRSNVRSAVIVFIILSFYLLMILKFTTSSI